MADHSENQAEQKATSPHSAPPLASEHSPDAEQQRSAMRDLPTGTVTLLFTDIEGSTRLLQQLGKRYTDMLAACRQILRETFHRWNGHEVDTQGDAFFVAFARATDALAAGVHAQRALAAYSWPEGVTVRMRMGLHTGEPQLSAEGYFGLDVHRTARIMSAGHGGQVLLSQTTRDLVVHDLLEEVSLRDLGEHRLKDLRGPERLFQLVIAELPADFPQLKTLDTHPHNLPVQPAPLIGREQEVAAVGHLVQREEVCLVTLTGPGGVGKTRLGLQVAAELSDRFADGLFFVNLAPVSDPTLVVPTIAQTLGIREVAGQPLLERLTEGLRQKQLLLLLDNFEQVLSAAVQVADLLAACPRLNVLVTSRERLHVRAEHEFEVPALALPDPRHLPDLTIFPYYAAVALFLERAQAIRPDFQLTAANAHAIAEICVRLDGLPLAIELAAVRIKVLSPQALLTRLSQRLTVLTSGARDVPERQRTLRNTIMWSYQLLDAQEQLLFRRLAAFAGGCTLQAIEAIGAALDGETGRVLEGVASLLDKSLLHQVEQEGEEPRLVMLETIREYALERLAASGEMEAIRQAHTVYYLALTEEAEPKLSGPQPIEWLQRLEREHDNLRAAMRWVLERWETGQNMEMALRLGVALEEFWVIRGHYSEGRTFLERALAAREGVATAVQAKALGTAARLALNQSDMDRGEALCEQSLSLWQELRDTPGIALSLQRLAVVAWVRNNPTVARSLTEEALVLWKEVGDKKHLAWALTWLASIASQQGEYVRALALCEESLALHRKLESKIGTADSLSQLAEVLYVSQSDPARVRSLLEEALALYMEVGDKMGIAQRHRFAGQLALSQGNTLMARSSTEEALALFREIGDRQGTVLSLSLLARVEARQGNHAAARALYKESLTMAAKGMGEKGVIASCLEGLAGLIASQGELAWAAQLNGAAEVLREAAGTPIPPVDRADYERTVASARAQFGEKAFAKALAEGRAMTPEQALAAKGQVTIPAPIPAEPSSAHSMISPASYPDGLTPREVEVLRLVAQGLTNEQVAEQLVISPRTVNTHLTSIFSKIGVSSRGAATRYAIEHHLA